MTGAFKRGKPGKELGPDKIGNEFYTLAGEQILAWITKFIFGGN